MILPSITGIAGLGILAACWRQVLSIAARVRSFAVVRVEIEDQLVGQVLHHCWTNFKRSPFGDRRYSSFGAYVRPAKRHIQIAVEKPPTQPLLFWLGWRPLLVSARQNSDMQGGFANDSRLFLTFLRWSFDSDALLIAAVDASNEANNGESQTGNDKRFCVIRLVGRDRNILVQQDSRATGREPAPCAAPYASSGNLTDRLLKWSAAEVGPPDPDDPLEAFAHPPEIKGLIQEITRWKKSREWFRAKRIPWRRGWLLYGKPGTGKTSLVRACAQLIDVPVYVYDLATLSNSELVGAWKEMLANTPCIALMEDMDAVFDGRRNVARSDGLTFDCLLNCIGGVEEADGVFTVVTTNDVSKIDPALGNPTTGEISTRPGRLDRAVELKGLTKECRLHIARRILSDHPEEVVGVVLEGDGDTGAQFQERCAQIALARYWKAAA